MESKHKEAIKYQHHRYNIYALFSERVATACSYHIASCGFDLFVSSIHSCILTYVFCYVSISNILRRFKYAPRPIYAGPSSNYNYF